MRAVCGLIPMKATRGFKIGLVVMALFIVFVLVVLFSEDNKINERAERRVGHEVKAISSGHVSIFGNHSVEIGHTDSIPSSILQFYQRHPDLCPYPFNRRSRYEFLDTVYVKDDDYVECGQVVGVIGCGRTTGPHIYFPPHPITKCLKDKLYQLYQSLV